MKSIMKKDLENAADAKQPGDAAEDAKDTTKKTGTTDGKSNALGGGGRFQQMKNKGMSGGLAAFIGRKMYGKKKMSAMSAAGKKG